MTTPREKTLYALLCEGVELLSAHAGEEDAVNRFVAVVERVRADYAKDVAEPAVYAGPVVAGMVFEYKGHRFVPDGRRGERGEFLDARGNGVSEPNLRGMYRPVAETPQPVCECGWCAACAKRFNEANFPAVRSPTAQPVCNSRCGTGASWAGSPMFDAVHGVYCTSGCRDAGRPLNPPPVVPGHPPGTDTVVVQHRDGCRARSDSRGRCTLGCGAVPPGPVPPCGARCLDGCPLTCALPPGHKSKRHEHAARETISGHAWLPPVPVPVEGEPSEPSPEAILGDIVEECPIVPSRPVPVAPAKAPLQQEIDNAVAGLRRTLACGIGLDLDGSITLALADQLATAERERDVVKGKYDLALSELAVIEPRIESLRTQLSEARGRADRAERAAKLHEADWQEAHAARLTEVEQWKGWAAEARNERDQANERANETGCELDGVSAEVAQLRERLEEVGRERFDLRDALENERLGTAQLRAKLEEETARADKFERKHTQDVHAHGRASMAHSRMLDAQWAAAEQRKGIDARVAASYRQGWTAGAEATREADVQALIDKFGAFAEGAAAELRHAPLPGEAGGDRG